jgi:predicted glycosyltransferase/peptidoglycan/xylan/chitin deacetylase (PgdA/CDA1 family)
MKKVMFYCQHSLGMGHLTRSMALVRGLAAFQVCFVNGGEVIPGFPLPSGVRLVNLPPLKADAEFRRLETVNDQSLAEVEKRRARCLLDTFEAFQPDALIVELFPFGRKKFRFELMPLLARIRAAGRRTKVICSLRDILVRRDDQGKYEARVVPIMQRYFDALLVHADPHFQRLDETFQRVTDLSVPVVYTGYVTQATEPKTATVHGTPFGSVEPLILISIGGGRVGYELVQASIEASQLLKNEVPHHALIFTGPFLPNDQYAQLGAAAAGQAHITLRRYTERFTEYMRQASLSVSLAGYNTCMDVLQARVPALVLPFTGGGNDEQTIRARKLEALGLVTVLAPETLDPRELAAAMRDRLRAGVPPAPFDLAGVAKTAAIVSGLLAERAESRGQDSTGLGLSDRLVEALRGKLDHVQAVGEPIHVFLRDDDVDEDEETLRRLLDISISRGVPVNLEIIPGRLTADATQLLKDHQRDFPALVELNQHGWQHANHEANGKKCEFGPSRTAAQQLADIARGKALLEASFGDRFYPVFTPPWNRCTADTFAALDRLGFAALSRDERLVPPAGWQFQEVPVTLDLFDWGGNPRLRAPEAIVADLLTQFDRGGRIGLMLHHKVMDDRAFGLLDQLLAELTTYPVVHFHTFQSLLALETADR